MSGTREENNLEEFDTKKTVAYLIFAAFLIFLLVLVYNFKEKYLKSYSLTSTSNNAKIADLIDIDSYESLKSGAGDDNGDGLSNWREMIYGSSAAGVSTNLSRDEDNIIISSSTNLTELLSRDLYVAAEYNKSNSNISATSLVSAIDKNYSKLLKPSEAITLNVISNPTFEEYRSYGNEMGLIFYVTLRDPIDTELKELAEEDSQFTDTKAKIKDIKRFCDRAKKIKVPISFQDNQLSFISNCDYYVASMEGFVNQKIDPYKTLLAIKGHKESIEAIVASSKYLSREFTKAKYNYNAKEYGYFFNVII